MATAVAAGPAWAELTPAQREALKPLQRDWNTLGPSRKQKWLEIADRFPKLAPAEQQRVQARMADWARLTPSERGQARQNYQEAKQRADREERQAKWQAYQALPEDERKLLADHAAARRARQQQAQASPKAGKPSAVGGNGSAALAKSNIVPNPLHSAPQPRPVTPTVLQAKPGATTNLMSRRATPPLHQQTGLPKIAATPEFVDSNTLLPQRGPQGAAVEPVRAY